jgi:hypoxanthine phosphoribosyltransferase
MKDLFAPTYQELHTLTLDICKHIQIILEDWYGLDALDGIIAPSRGGLLVGTIVSHYFGVPLTPISYSSKIGRGDDKNHNNVLPVLPGGLYILVDDIIDSGHTFKELFEHYTLNSEIVTAAWYYKQGAVCRVPGTCGIVLPANAEFVSFPYEVAQYSSHDLQYN